MTLQVIVGKIYIRIRLNNKNLVYYHSKYYIKKHNLDYHRKNDLYQEGFVGLFTACDKYNNTYNNTLNINT